MPYARDEAITNLKNIARDFDVYVDGLGFKDSVNVQTKLVSDRMLALDQGMIIAALADRLCPGLLQQPFRSGDFATRVHPLLAKERFTIFD